jgi:hypothetical protein
MTTTPSTTTRAASGPTLGDLCTDYDKLASDSNTGEKIVCGSNTSGPTAKLMWVEAGDLAGRGVHAAGTPCPDAPQGWPAESTDGYMIVCQASDDGSAYEPGGVKLTNVGGPIWQLFSP